MNRLRGFTVIELLVVVTIIAILVALGTAGAMTLVFRAKSLATAKRLDEAATAIGAVAATRGGAAFALATRLGLQADLPLPYTTSPPYVQPVGLTASSWSGAIDRSYADATLRSYAHSDSDHVASQFPAGGPKEYFLGETVGPWGRIPIAGGAVAPVARTIRTMSPFQSLFFLVEAGVLPAATPVASYRDDRRSERAWNDRWGNPLVVSYLLYQAGGDPLGEHKLDTALGRAAAATAAVACTDARRAYGSNRILHLSLAAGGKRITGASGNAMKLPSEVWNHVLTVTSAGDAAAPIWDETSFAAPPWRNVKTTRNTLGDAWLMAPIEVR